MNHNGSTIQVLDLDRKLVFPNIVETNLRPDAVLVSQQSKTLVAIKLTVQWEENCEEAHERKRLKYAHLMADCKDKGWSVWLFPVEVGCRGFPAQSVWKLLARLDTQDNNKKTVEAAERSSCWIWHCRDDLCLKSGSVEQWTGHHC